jgi:urease accessory protein UreE
MRQKAVLDSGDEIVGTVANLYVDEDSRQLRFVDVTTDDQHYIFLGLEKKHHLLPVEAVSEEDSGSITLEHVANRVVLCEDAEHGHLLEGHKDQGGRCGRAGDP